ncbi:branched-chain amino acid transport system II carrier protein [Moraxella sp. ZY210820]|uniref:branched-chain amino acid transport system II carrier protein n=1 Tax=unclassified Moraxella TaxID=2685852 RepID=UPI0027311E1A|nr:branched-chain amino acid transport system II carrier protein [Moraxella sp. ZY210820]WLF83242.1 branched-chain amino acid transport system II carrier protein [Moraxella sp. ZY210820]
MSQSTSYRTAFIATGLMLFALFFGAGNLIFPAGMGQQAGENIAAALTGFLLTGVGLPLLGVIAIAYSGSRDVQQLASRVAPWYGIWFAVMLYLAIGPFFATPRTATVSFEIGVLPFLGEVDESSQKTALFVYAIGFFALSYWLSVSPGKLVDRIGKILTPVLLVTILVLTGYALISPMGELQAPAEAYQAGALTKGVIEGYGTMDALASLVFAIIVIEAIRNMGVTDNKQVLSLTTRAGLVAAGCLAIVYVLIGYMGANSVSVLGTLDSGAKVLSGSADFYFGALGKSILAVIVFLACLSTSVGLITACGEYFNRLVPKLSYHQWVIIFTLISFTIANFGLANIIKFSIPALMLLYPLTIAIIALAFLDKLFDGKRIVYVLTIAVTSLFAIIDGWKTLHGMFEGSKEAFIMQLDTQLSNILPLYSSGLGWILPAIVAFIISVVIAKSSK